jgi:hypothetical protein
VALYQMSYGRRFHCGAPGVPGDVDYYTAAFASCQLQICIFLKKGRFRPPAAYKAVPPFKFAAADAKKI